MSRWLVMALLVSYALLVLAAYRFLDWPWNIAVAGLLLFKGTVFWAIMGKVRKLGTRRGA